MKKIVCALAMTFVLVCGLFAEGEKKSGFDYHNIKIEAGIPLDILGIGLDLRGSYQFPINESWWWNVGIDTDFQAYILGSNISILGFGSIGWKSIYLTYGLGLGINTSYGGAGFIPLDLRFGWQPRFHNHDSGLSFKIEGGFFGMWAATKLKIGESKDGYKLDADDMGFLAPFGVNLGVAYKF